MYFHKDTLFAAFQAPHSGAATLIINICLYYGQKINRGPLYPVGIFQYLYTVKRHFNTHIQGIDLKFWHDLIKSHGKLVTLKRGEYLSHRGEPTNAIGFVLSGYLLYTILTNP